ncbi:MAG TPA: hypothetical protein GXZ30_12455 [Propionibacterium sp.]|nr:hypothetical protein [Propionibacterium sp.]
MWTRWLPSAQMTRGHRGEIEDYLAPMRRQGASVDDCLQLIVHVERVDFAEANRILDASPAWADLRRRSGA